jgi:hypothetical protein
MMTGAMPVWRCPVVATKEIGNTKIVTGVRAALEIERDGVWLATVTTVPFRSQWLKVFGGDTRDEAIQKAVKFLEAEGLISCLAEVL